MTDIERQRLIASAARPNKVLPARHPINLLYRAVVMAGSLYGLHSMSVFHSIMRSPEVDHQWFKLGLAGSIAISIIKAYMELYEAKIRKQKVEYQSYKNLTHAVMILILLTSVAFHKSLWQAYGGLKTMLIMFLFGWGVLLQLCLFLPPSIQNALAFIGLTFFLQQYK